jgi:hypothetical protein
MLLVIALEIVLNGHFVFRITSLVGRGVAQTGRRCFSLRGLGFEPGWFHGSFVVDEVPLEQSFLRISSAFPC